MLLSAGISKQGIPEPGIPEQTDAADFKKETALMGQYDKKVIDCFLKNQRQLFPEDVAKRMSAATLKKILLILRAAIPWRPRRSSRSATAVT